MFKLFYQSCGAWKTASNIDEVSVTPRDIVPQKIPTPTQHIIVAIRVAYGILVTHFCETVMQMRKF